MVASTISKAVDTTKGITITVVAVVEDIITTDRTTTTQAITITIETEVEGTKDHSSGTQSEERDGKIMISMVSKPECSK